MQIEGALTAAYYLGDTEATLHFYGLLPHVDASGIHGN
jgi:hypothetical protein